MFSIGVRAIYGMCHVAGLARTEAQTRFKPAVLVNVGTAHCCHHAHGICCRLACRLCDMTATLQSCVLSRPQSISALLTCSMPALCRGTSNVKLGPYCFDGVGGHILLRLRSSTTLHAGFILMTGTAAMEWTFQLGSDDGSYLYIDGNVIVANGGVPLRFAPTERDYKFWNLSIIHNLCDRVVLDGHGTSQHHEPHRGLIVAWPCVGAHGFVTKDGNVMLTPGLHAIRVDYFQRDAPADEADIEQGGLVLQVTALP